MADEELDHPVLPETGNGPTVSYEEGALEALYGPPDADGVYGALPPPACAARAEETAAGTAEVPARGRRGKR